ncbi:hypothetical protein HSX11_05740 [Oxalobacteraceae bacterium]|nr:hypothetical protein [Oxalobacteraceae bacterium]
MSIDARFLLDRLPRFFEVRDAGQNGALRALLEVIAEQGALMEADIARLYDNWFIETCEDWAVPYIGELLGVRGLYSVAGTQAFGQRALVANTLRLRRRKGTLPVLEELAFDTTGWRAHAVEFFQLLSTTQHMNHRRLHSTRTPDLRLGASMANINGPFDTAAHTAEVRTLPAGRYNIPNIGLYLWRLSAYALERGDASAEPAHTGLYRFDGLGRDLALFNRPRSETELAHISEPLNVPGRLTRRVLRDELEAIRQALADQIAPTPAYFSEDDGGAVLRIWVDGKEIPPRHLVVCNLSPLPSGPLPRDWRRPPLSMAVQPADSSAAPVNFPSVAGEFLVGFDPELGRIALPDGKTATRVEVAYAYGFPGDVGGGPYDRRAPSRAEEVSSGLLRPQDFDTVLRVSDALGDQPTLAAAMALVVAGKRYLIVIDNDAAAGPLAALDLPDTHLALEAGPRHRPVLHGDLAFKGNASSRLSLSGIVLDGSLRLDGPLREVNLRHCTLVPGRGGIVHTAAGASDLRLILRRCVCGPLKVQHSIGLVRLDDCIVDAGGAMPPNALALPDTLLELDHCTVIGNTQAAELAAGNSIFTGKLDIAHRQQGCVRFCYVPRNSATPRRYRCQPDMVMHELTGALADKEAIRVIPSFTATSFSDPAYMQLALASASEIRLGADNGAEMGAWNLLMQPQREANLKQALDEYLRFGLAAAAIFVN